MNLKHPNPVSWSQYVRDFLEECSSSLAMTLSHFVLLTIQSLSPFQQSSCTVTTLSDLIYLRFMPASSMWSCQHSEIYSGIILLFLQNCFSHRYHTWTLVPMWIWCGISTQDMTGVSACLIHRSSTIARVKAIWALYMSWPWLHDSCLDFLGWNWKEIGNWC